jgi:hypothetical protein
MAERAASAVCAAAACSNGKTCPITQREDLPDHRLSSPRPPFQVLSDEFLVPARLELGGA